MRVLMVSWEYPPVVAGGLGRHVRRLSEQLVAAGARVDVVTRGPGQLSDAGGVVVHRVAGPDFPRDDLDAFLAWVEGMNDGLLDAAGDLDGGFDVVHSHDWLVAGAGRALARRFGVPWVVTVHATEHGRHQGRVGQHPQRHIHAAERRMAHDADAVIVCSEYMRGHVAEVLGAPAARLAAVPNGVDAAAPGARSRRAERTRLAAPGERLVLLAGRLVYEKGFHVALDALPRLIDRVGGLRFVVAGSGPAEDELRAQAERLGLMEHGTFAGWAGDELLGSLYAAADVCVVPSLYEPFGLVALEAMAAGCPCLAADTGGLRELVPHGRAGLRFRPGDPRALARAAERLLADAPLRARLTAGAAEHVRRFDWAEAARRTAAVYEEIAPVPPADA